MAPCDCVENTTSEDPAVILKVLLANNACMASCEALRQDLIEWVRHTKP